MEHNEPLNLSIKKRPIAVVIPSSVTNSASTNELLCNNEEYTNSSNAMQQQMQSQYQQQQQLSQQSQQQLSSPINTHIANDVQNLDLSTVMKENLLNDSISNRLTSNPMTSSTSVIPSTIQTVTDATSTKTSATITKESVDSERSDNLDVVDDETSVPIKPERNTKLADLLSGSHIPMSDDSVHTSSVDVNKVLLSTNIANTLPLSSPPVIDKSVPIPPSIASATSILTSYLNQQESLDVAKFHLERYLKVTNQLLHTTLNGSNMTSNEQLNHLIRTSILTNKIAANNLISIINKLLQQNIISEYYFKHASKLMMQTYDDVAVAAAAAALAAAQNSTVSRNATDKDLDLSDSADIHKLSSHFALSPPSYPSISPTHTLPPPPPSELLKRLAQAPLNECNDLGGEPTDYESDNESNNTGGSELYDYEEKIKKETIQANPFISYLHMHMNRNFELIDNGSSPNALINANKLDSLGLQSFSSATSTSKSKGSKNQTETVGINVNNNNSNQNKSMSLLHQTPYDLSLNLSQRLILNFPVTLSPKQCFSLLLSSFLNKFYFIFSPLSNSTGLQWISQKIHQIVPVPIR